MTFTIGTHHLEKATTAARLTVMREVAAAKAARAHGAPQFWQEVEVMLEQIAVAKLAGMSPINQNLLGLAFMLQAEIKRLQGR